jgi:hypothetical protein
MGNECSLHLYKSFLREPLERNLFADRVHIFFPWMVEVINEKNVKYKKDFYIIKFSQENFQIKHGHMY